MGKAHLDPFPLVARLRESFGLHKCAGQIASIFMDITGHLARGLFRTALRFEQAGIAGPLCGAIEQRAPIMHRAAGLQQLAGRAVALNAFFDSIG